MIHRLTVINVFFVIMVIMTTLMAFNIALSTKAIAHPDESIHLDAFCYFQLHLWPPDLNDPSLLYSPDGWSRVYNGEIVYPLFGQIGRRITPSVQRFTTQFATFPVVLNESSQKFHVFLPIISRSVICEINRESIQLLNICLFVITLLLLWFGFNQSTIARATALALLMIPQVVYIYSYANSDAWGITCSILFAAYVLSRTGILVRLRSSLILGLFTSAILLSKTPFWFTLLFGWSYLLLELWNSNALSPVSQRVIFRNLLVCGITVALLVTPLKIIYPLSQGNFTEKAEQMREEHARADFKPSNLTGCCYRMAAKGIPFGKVATDPEWIRKSLKSFYGFFGHLSIESPWWAYAASISFFGINLLITLLSLIQYRNQIGQQWYRLAFLSLFILVLNIFGSMYNSWTYDFQPQGRYLFPSLVPITILTLGCYEMESRNTRMLRLCLWFGMYLLTFQVLKILF